MIRSSLLAGAAMVLVATRAAAAATLQVAVAQSPAGLDPHVTTAFSSLLIYDNIYDGLTVVAPDLTVQPALATDWAISEDGMTYTFTLREGVTFHNGDAFDAGDVVASIERVMAEETGSPIASRFTSIEGMSADGPHQITLQLSEPYSPLLSQLATLMIVSEEYLAAGGDLQREPVGTGAFMLSEWAPDTYLHLDAHGDYWLDGLPRVDAVRFSIVPEASTRQIGIATGTYHLMPEVDAATALLLDGDPNVVLLETNDLAYSLIGLNVAEPPFDNPTARLALNYALDREAIIAAALFGKGDPAGPLPLALSGTLPTSAYPCYQPDADQARALLDESGVDPAFTLNVLGSLQQVVDIAQVAQAQLNAAGFEVELNVQELGEFVQDWRNSNFTAFVSLNGGSIDPDGHLYRTVRSGGSTNVFGYADPQIDAWLDRARSETDPEARTAIYADVQRALACEGPIAFLTFGVLATAHRPEVTGFVLSPNRSLRSLRSTSITE